MRMSTFDRRRRGLMIRFERIRVVCWALALGLGCGTVRAQESAPKARDEATWPGLTRAGTVILPNGWSLKPAGRQVKLGDFPVAVAEHPTEPVLAVLHAGYGEHEVVTLEAASGKVIARVALKESFQGLTWSSDGKRLFVGGGWDDVVYRFDHSAGLLSNKFEIKYPAKVGGRRVPAGLAVAKDGEALWVANAFGHTLAKFDGAGNLQLELDLGPDSYPYGLAWDEPDGRLYVSLWAKAEVAVVDSAKGEVVAHWATQEHPNEILLSQGGKVLYVANANRNTVSVFDAKEGKAVETIGTAIDPNAPPGSTPSSLALTPDEELLFVANANTNDVAVFNVKELGESKPLGFIPAGWYPTSVRVARAGKTLYIANGKGTSSKANRDGPNPLAERTAGVREYIAGLFQGSLSILPIPGPKEMLAHSKTVYECSPLRARANEGIPSRPANHPIPAQVGDPSPIKHVVYIVKENRTYDQVFGDLPEGNGEKALCLFPEEATPNHHALVREFVLLDNFYAEAEVSADGHEWSMGAYASDFVERTWPLSYRGDRRVPYPSEGALAIARPANGYIWDRAAAKGLSYRSYGEFIKNGATPNDPSTTSIEALKGHFDPRFRGYDLSYPDVKRADRFLEELAGFEKSGDLPNLIVLRLPNDHTSGTRPGGLTVTAMVADNDLALGRVVEGLSKSRFWPNLAIFVVEDDAQNGSDHVDAHRTVALAISPYIKKHSVDSTMYSTSSMLRTMELILGLEPMSQFDAAARPMAASFVPNSDLAPFAARPARVDLNARNGRDAFGAEVSMELDLDEAEDRADDLVFNEIIWKAVKGKDSPMPPPVRSAFVLPRGK
jgi:DNA-binding beta-propeller fold protein YncE